MVRMRGWLGVAIAGWLCAPAYADRATLGIAPEPVHDREPPQGECRVVDLDLLPAANVQLVVWVETPAGAYVDTIFITQSVGRFGIGNRIGLFGMRSGPRWPYGPRPDVFPVWAHRHGRSWPVVHYQRGDGVAGVPTDIDHNLSQAIKVSSAEIHFIRPVAPAEPEWDTGTTASQVFTDKGRFSPTLTSLYPPRADLERDPNRDHPDVAMFRAMNPFDAVSQATPPANQPFRFTWLIPPGIYDGTARDYVMFVEVSSELDHNATYNADTQPPLPAAGWNEYGLPYRGQPALVYRVPFTVGPMESRGLVTAYVGYADPMAADGAIRPPDATITDDAAAPGSGARRLALVDDAVTGEQYRVRVAARFEVDEEAPGPTEGIDVIGLDGTSADLAFVAPGDDGRTVGRVAGYDIRTRVGGPMTLDNFGASRRVFDAVSPVAAGQTQTVHLDGLIPLTEYQVGIRAYDSCRNYGPLQTVQLSTPDRESGEVSACFIATAAYGSAMARDVALLRRFRDGMLRGNVLGELAVETYYTFGPALAGVIGRSELLRATARTALEPVVGWTRDRFGASVE